MSRLGSRTTKAAIRLPVAMALCLCAGQAGALPDAADGVRVFPPSYFTAYAPENALDLIAQVPGFQLEEQGGGRGLGDVGGNILIDGVRRPPKGKSLRNLLEELPVRSIANLELISVGGRPELDMQGYRQVVNVVTLSEMPPFLEAVLGYSRQGTGDPDMTNGDERRVTLRGSADVAGHTLSARVNARGQRRQSPGGFGAIDPDDPALRVATITRRDIDDLVLEGGGLFALPGDGTLLIDTRFSRRDSATRPAFDEITEVGLLLPADDKSRDDLLFSGELRRPVSESLEGFLSLVHARRSNSDLSSLRIDALERTSRGRQRSGETAGRIGLQWRPDDGLMLGGEVHAAYNFLEGRVNAFENGIERALEVSESRVTEPRAGAALNWQWQALGRLNVQGDVGVDVYETKTETAPGSAGPRQDTRGALAATWTLKPRSFVSVEVERSVSQLSFGQFLTSTSLDSDAVTQGALELDPPRAWRKTLRLDHRFDDRGLFDLRLTRLRTGNPIELVPLSDTIVVSQNTRPQTLDTLSSSLSWPLDGLGFAGTLIDLDGSLSSSRAVDPATGEVQPISGVAESFWSLGLRKEPDNTSVSWGIRIFRELRENRYAARSTEAIDASIQWSGFLEWSPTPALRLRTDLIGPSQTESETALFAQTRHPGTVPAYLSGSESERELGVAGSLEWRPTNQVEITLTAATGQALRTAKSLLPFGGLPEVPEIREFAATPSVGLQLRLTN